MTIIDVSLSHTHTHTHTVWYESEMIIHCLSQTDQFFTVDFFRGFSECESVVCVCSGVFRLARCWLKVQCAVCARQLTRVRVNSMWFTMIDTQPRISLLLHVIRASNDRGTSSCINHSAMKHT